MSWNYYGNKTLRDIGISNHTPDLSQIIGRTRLITRAFCNSSVCVGWNASKSVEVDVTEDDCCARCGSSVIYKSKRLSKR